MNCNPTPYDPRQTPYARGTSPYIPKVDPYAAVPSPFAAIISPILDGCFPAVLLYPEDGYPVMFDDGVTIKL